MKSKFKLLFNIFILAFLALPPVFTQRVEHPGVSLFRDGKFREAACALSEAVKDSAWEQDALTWNYLGRAYAAIDNFFDASKAFENAVNLDPKRAEFHIDLANAYFYSKRKYTADLEFKKALDLQPNNATAYLARGSTNLYDMELDAAMRDADKALEISSSYPEPFILKARILLAKLGVEWKGGLDKSGLDALREIRELLKSGVEKTKISFPNNQLIEQLASVEAFCEAIEKNPDYVLKPAVANDPAITPLQFLSKPRPGYTDTARQANVQGTVKLLVLFAADGTTRNILVLNSLRNGLSEQAIEAVRKIQFTPMLKDGKPVSVVTRLEYTFSVY